MTATSPRPEEKNYDVLVIGAGAAGLMAAGTAALSGASVIILEKNDRPGKKILLTGKGRCNITSSTDSGEFFRHIHPNPRFMRTPLNVFSQQQTIAFFNNLGLETVVERGERVFPRSNRSADVVAALLSFNRQHKVQMTFNARVDSIQVTDNRVSGVSYTHLGQKKKLSARQIVLCAGGSSYPATGSNGDGVFLARALGHSIVKVRPALVPLETVGDLAPRLQGLSLRNVRASVWSDGKKHQEQFGEMLFTHFGLSGPIILSLSRQVVDFLKERRDIEISVDLKPALDEKKLDLRLQRDLKENNKKKLENLFKMWLPAKMIPVFFDLAGLERSRPAYTLSAKERKNLRNMMKDLRFQVTKNRSFKEAIITAGGISTLEINPRTMESRKVNNLFFAGEIIDLDGDTGGFNLQIAWSTGCLAGLSVSRKK